MCSGCLAAGNHGGVKPLKTCVGGLDRGFLKAMPMVGRMAVYFRMIEGEKASAREPKTRKSILEGLERGIRKKLDAGMKAVPEEGQIRGRIKVCLSRANSPLGMNRDRFVIEAAVWRMVLGDFFGVKQLEDQFTVVFDNDAGNSTGKAGESGIKRIAREVEAVLRILGETGRADRIGVNYKLAAGRSIEGMGTIGVVEGNGKPPGNVVLGLVESTLREAPITIITADGERISLGVAEEKA